MLLVAQIDQCDAVTKCLTYVASIAQHDSFQSYTFVGAFYILRLSKRDCHLLSLPENQVNSFNLVLPRERALIFEFKHLLLGVRRLLRPV